MKQSFCGADENGAREDDASSLKPPYRQRPDAGPEHLHERGFEVLQRVEVRDPGNGGGDVDSDHLPRPWAEIAETLAADERGREEHQGT